MHFSKHWSISNGARPLEASLIYAMYLLCAAKKGDELMKHKSSFFAGLNISWKISNFFHTSGHPVFSGHLAGIFK